MSVPVPYVARSERTHVHAPSLGHEQFFILLHRAQELLASVSNRGCEAIGQNKADSVTAPLNNLSS